MQREWRKKKIRCMVGRMVGPLTQEEITVTHGQSRREIKRSRGLPKNGFSNNGPDSTQGLRP